MSDSLTASELQHLRILLQRFTEHHLDQWDNWRFDTSYGPAFIQVTWRLEPEVPAEAFTPLSKPEPVSTGRFAHVSDSAAVDSRDGLLRVITEMRDDLAGTGAREWENPSLEGLLEALQGFLSDLDGYYANQGQQLPAEPRWGLFATALVAATGYE